MAAESTTFFSQETRGEILTALFTSGARAEILRLFLLDPTRAYYQRQMESATGLALRAVQRELERLTAVGLLYRRVEGNRTYFRVDPQFPLYPELRNMVLKTSSDVDRLRGRVATEPGVRLAFVLPDERRALVVTEGDATLSTAGLEPFSIRVVSMDAFSRALFEEPDRVGPFLERGLDLLGRRDDAIWRRIEAAGYRVQKGKGVA